MTDSTDDLKTETTPRMGIGCPHAMTIVMVDSDTEIVHAFETQCGRWTCDRCGPWKKWKLCQRISLARPTKFITLTTANHKSRTPREVWEATRRKLPELIRWIRERNGECEYCRVMERHKSGYPHFHLVVRTKYVEKEALSQYWCKLTDAFIVDIRKIRPDDGVADYVAKYITKDFDTTISRQRVTQSRHFFEKAEKPDKLDIAWCDIHRHRLTFKNFRHYESPYSTWEEEGPNHWVMVDPRDKFPRGKRIDPEERIQRPKFAKYETDRMISRMLRNEPMGTARHLADAWFEPEEKLRTTLELRTELLQTAWHSELGLER